VVICAKTAELIEMLFGLWTWVGPRKHALDWAQIPHAKGQLLRERTSRACQQHCRELCKNGWTNWFAVWFVWTQVGQRKHKFSCVCQVVPICPHWRAHWCNLVNTT